MISLPGDDKSIAGLFARALGRREASAYTFVTYRWDDPTTDKPMMLRTSSRDRKVPGTSCKRSYIELADLSEKTADAVGKISSISWYSPSFRLHSLTSSVPELIPEMKSVPADGEIPTNARDTGNARDAYRCQRCLQMMDDDDGACAIAGAGHTSQSTLLNLFLDSVCSVLGRFP